MTKGNIIIRIKKLLDRKSIRYRLLLYFLTLILLPTVSLGLIGNTIYSISMEKQVSVHTSEMLNQVNKSIESYVSEIEKVINTISQDPNIIDYLHLDNNENVKRIEIETAIRRLFTSIKESFPEVAGILISTDNDLYISNELFKIQRDPIYNEQWYRLAQLNPELIQTISKPLGRNLSTSLDYTADDIISIAKAIRDDDTKETLGVLLVDFKLSTIKEIVEGITLGKKGYVYVADNLGNIVYAPVNNTVFRINNKWIEGGTGNIKKLLNNEPYQIVYEKSKYTKWSIIGVFSEKETLKDVENQRYYAIITGCVTLVIAFIAALFFTSSITKPVNKLKKLMSQAEEGNLNVQFAEINEDEISMLGRSFNKMIQKIDHLIKMVYDEQKSKREAELKALQAQIKPHFLYNTLDTIQFLAQKHGANDVVEVINALSNLFRIGLNRGAEIINLSDEIQHIKSYLIIQKIRYAEKLNYTITIDDALYRFKVLKLILQPLIENAIYHGIKQKRGKGNILINAKLADGRIIFRIIDDGQGIAPEKVSELNAVLDGTKDKNEKSGFGLFNVNERIKLAFGNDFGIHIQSIQGKETIIEVTHPIIEGE